MYLWDIFYLSSLKYWLIASSCVLGLPHMNGTLSIFWFHLFSDDIRHVSRDCVTWRFNHCVCDHIKSDIVCVKCCTENNRIKLVLFRYFVDTIFKSPWTYFIMIFNVVWSVLILHPRPVNHDLLIRICISLEIVQYALAFKTTRTILCFKTHQKKPLIWKLILPTPNGGGYVFISVGLLLAKIYNFWQVCSFVGLSVCLSVSLSVLSSITHERFNISSPNLVHIWNGWAVPVCDIDK